MNRSYRIEELFHGAADLPPNQRDAFLSDQCGEDATLRAAVEELLQYDASAVTAEAIRSPVMAQREELDGMKTPSQIGHYRIISTLGEGGMGSVYEAEQLRPVKRAVALKVIKLGMDTREVIARFEAERQALAMMDHPHIARVYDAGATETGRPYFVMEFVRGVRITRYCDEHTLSTRDRLELFIKVCDAVQHAHMKGIIHRDLKPGNILVTEIDGQPSPKVIDFGIVKATSTPLTERTLQTEMGAMLGTPEYMSPEQARSGDSADVDTRSDVYSLGAVLYELLSGAQPFDATSLRSQGYQEIQRILRDVDPPRPSTRITRRAANAENVAAMRQETAASLSNRLRRELEWIPLMAMRKDRDQRYRSAADLADDVRAYLAGRPLIAAPESRAYRVKKFLRRNRGAVAAFATIIGLLITGIVTTSVQAIRANREKAFAEQRFTDVRALVRGMLFDVQGKVGKIAGSQEATRAIVELAKEYLEKLQAEKSNDLDLLVDVAAAYGKLGDIQGRSNLVSFNDLPAARKSWERALELANRALTLAPNDPSTLKAVGEAEFSLADADDEKMIGVDVALTRYQRALALYTASAALGPGNPDTELRVLRTRLRIADMHYQKSRVTESIQMQSDATEQIRALLKRNPENREATSMLASALTNLSTYRKRVGDQAGSETSRVEAVEWYTSLHAADPNDSSFEYALAANQLALAILSRERNDFDAATRYLALALEHARHLTSVDTTSPHLQNLLGDILMNDSSLRSNLNQPELAARSLKEAIAVQERLVAANANDGRARAMLSICYSDLGLQFEGQGKHDEAIQAISKAAETIEGQATADPKSFRFHAQLAYYDRLIGQFQAAAGRFDEAIATIRRAVARFDRIVAAVPDDSVNRRNGLMARQALAEVLLGMAASPQTEIARRNSSRNEAIDLLRTTRDGYAPLLKVDKPVAMDVEAVSALNKQINELTAPATQPAATNPATLPAARPN